MVYNCGGSTGFGPLEVFQLFKWLNFLLFSIAGKGYDGAMAMCFIVALAKKIEFCDIGSRL